MQISYNYIVWNNVPKFLENRASSFWAMRQSMWVIIVVSLKWGLPATLEGGGRTNQIVIRSEKFENHKKSSHSKIKFYMIFM